MTELMPSLCNDCVARNQCGNDDVKMCISYTKETKIKCDDCKFVENCVDYGWQECKKFTPKPSEPMTNEEYIQTCNTEQLAKFIFWQHFDVYGKTIYELMVNASRGVSRDKQAEVMIGAVVEWLKQPHTKE